MHRSIVLDTRSDTAIYSLSDFKEDRRFHYQFVSNDNKHLLGWGLMLCLWLGPAWFN